MDFLGLARGAHSTLQTVALSGAGLLILVTSLAWLAARRDQPWAAPLWALGLALIVIVPVAIALSSAVGLVLFAETGGPRDGLHAVYSGVALLALPLAWVLGAGPPPAPDDPREPTEGSDAPLLPLSGRHVLWLIAGAAITIGALLRLTDTG